MNQSNHIANIIRRATTGFLLMLCMVLTTSSLQAQGWEQYIGANDFDELFDITQTRDFGFLATGYINDDKIVVYRFDPEGNILWVREDLANSAGGQGHAVIETNDGSIVVVGYCNACDGGSRDLYVIKLDKFGETIWSEGFGGAKDDEAWDVIEDQDGNFIITGYFDDGTNENVYLLKLDPTDGSVLLDRKYNGRSNEDDKGLALVEASDNDYIIAGSTNTGANDTYTYLLKISSTTGDTIWTQELDNGSESIAYDIIESINVLTGLAEGYALTGSINNNDIFFLKTDLDGKTIASANYGDAGADQGNAIVQTSNGGYLIAGTEGLNGTTALPTLIQIDSDGFSIWAKTYGDGPNGSNSLIAASAQGLTANQEGGYTIVGFRSEGQTIPDPADAFIIKVDEQGNHYTNVIQGRIFFDFNDNCEMDPIEFGFENWSIMIQGDQNFYQTSGIDGFFNIPVASGDYEVSLIPPSDYWSACTNAISISLSNPYDSASLNFPVQVEELCAYLEVDASTPYLTPCTDAEYYISYCNEGTISAQEAYIIADLDPSLVLTGATRNYTFLGGNSYRFDLDNVAIEECDSFRVTVLVDCNAIIGQTHCFAAHIFPDTLCSTGGGNWDGSSIGLAADCNGNQVDLRIRNTGTGDMTDPQGYVIIEDDLMYRPSGPVQLDKGQDSIIVLPANGATYRIIMEQPEGHPGKSMPSAAIEGCVDGVATFSTGFYTTFAEDDADNFLVKDCQENIPSTDIPDHAKRGYPKGYSDDRLITPETELKYILNFANNGPDTAIRMVIRDTLSPFLDPTTVRPGASSHNYTFEVTGEGILKFTFEDINLHPSSSANSRGFVKYTVSQKLDNPAGALIKNGAAIFYNYGHPNYTENTCHKIENFVRVSTNEIFNPAVQEVKVFPNPFVESATVEIVSTETYHDIRFRVFDTSGKLVYEEQHDGSVFTIRRNNLPAGFYFYQLEANAQLLSTGKVIMQ